MDQKQFITICCDCGYCAKSIAKKYVTENPKTNYDNNDLIEVSRIRNDWKGSHTKGLRRITGGSTTAYNNIQGNSGRSQDWC